MPVQGQPDLSNHDLPWAAPPSGTSMNPARLFGPARVSGDWTAYWVSVAGSVLGAAIAVGCAMNLRGRGPGDPDRPRRLGRCAEPRPLGRKNKLSQELGDGTVVPPGLDQTSAPGGS